MEFVVFSALYSLQGAPAAIVDGYLPQILHSQAVFSGYYGLAALLYLPFNFRFWFAAIFETHGCTKHPIATLRVLLLAISCLLCASSFFAVRENIVSVYVVFALIMFLVATCDPLMDSLLLESRSRGQGSLQMIAWKGGKFVAAVFVSTALTRLNLGWTLCLRVFAAIYLVVTLFCTFKLQVNATTDSADDLRKPGTVRGLLRHEINNLLAKPALLVLAVTEKLGEVLVERVWIVFTLHHLSDTSHERALISFLAAVLVLGFNLKSLGAELLYCVCLLRVLTLAWMAQTATEFAVADPSTGLVSVTSSWRLASACFAFSSGFSSPLFVVVALSHSKSLTMYSLLESFSSWSKMLGSVLSGFALAVFSDDFQQQFALASVLSCFPMCACVGLVLFPDKIKRH